MKRWLADFLILHSRLDSQSNGSCCCYTTTTTYTIIAFVCSQAHPCAAFLFHVTRPGWW